MAKQQQQRIKVRVKQKQPLFQRIKTVIKILLIFLLIAGILAFTKSCSDPWFEFDKPNNKFGDFLEFMANLFPGGVIGMKGDSGEPTDDTTEKEDDTIPGEDAEQKPGEDGTVVTTCSCGGILKHYESSATCVSAGYVEHYECLKCGLLYDTKGAVKKLDDLVEPINPDAHSSDSKLVSNEDGTHTFFCTYDNSHIKLKEECKPITDQWHYLKYTHFHLCICGYMMDEERHEDFDGDLLCDVCGAPMPEDSEEDENGPPGSCSHEDGNDDGICDLCSATINGGNNEGSTCEHRDANDDGTCDLCGEEFEDGEDVTEPENPGTNPGTGTDACSECGQSMWSEWQSLHEATCTEAGHYRRTCGKCGATQDYQVPALGHYGDESGGVAGDFCICERCHEEYFPESEAAVYAINGDENEVTHCPVCGEAVNWVDEEEVTLSE